MGKLMLFTDGSVDPGSGKGCGAYLAFEDYEPPVESLVPRVKIVSFDQTSSTKLELQVLLHVLGELQGFRGKIMIHTDSQNVVELVGRRTRLEAADYLSGRGKLLNHHDLYRKFYQYIDALDCELVKVKGHRASYQKDYVERVFTLVDKASRRALRDVLAG
jgi:ribonuclease HI